MAERYYFDTSIWRDYYEDRSDNLRPLGEFALQLIKNIIRTGGFILYSEGIVEELQIKYSNEDIIKIFEIASINGALLKVNTSLFQKREAARLCKVRNIAFGDALHAILARDNDAIMVARDNHFFELMNLVEVRKPEELI